MTEVQECTWSQINNFHYKENSLSVLCINMRSLVNKFSELKAHLALIKQNISFIAVTETWLNPDKDVNFELDGYKSVSLYREHAGGGIKLFYLENLCVSRLDELSSTNGPAETLIVRTNIPGYGSIDIGCFYRPPNKSVNNFLVKMNEILHEIGRNRVVIMGDFNIDTLDSCTQTRDYVDLLTSYGFSNGIKAPTYISPSGLVPTSCLDHIWFNLPLQSKSYIIGPNIADHFAVSTIFEVKIDNPPIIIKFRDFSSSNLERFKANLESEFQSFSPPNHCVNLFANYLENFLQSILDKYFPLKSKQISTKRLRSPWINKEILYCIRKKHHLHRRAKYGEINFHSYRNYCSLLRYLLDTAEKDYYVQKLNQLGDDQVKNWRLINKLLNRGSKDISDRFLINHTYTTDSHIISNNFNSYFINHPLLIAENIPQSDGDYLAPIDYAENLIDFSLATREEVFEIITSLKKNGSLNDIPRIFLKTCAPYLSSHLCYLFNLCVRTGCFPETFKLAKITPIFKKGSKQEISNYRPIAILKNLSKIFESLIYVRLSTGFSSQNILSDNQFGFRRGKNTEMACLSLVDRILPAFRDNCFAIAVFLDFRACFDTLSRTILTDKLRTQRSSP